MKQMNELRVGVWVLTRFGWMDEMILRCHQFSLGAIWADDIFLFIWDEATSDQWRLADAADEAIVVPVAIFKWDETSAANALK